MKKVTPEMKEEALRKMVKNGKIPQSIFKYRADDKFTEIIFIDKTLWFSHPNAFNDPFDCWANVAEPKSTDIQELIENNVEIPYEKAMCYAGVPTFNKKMLKECVDKALSEIGVCCFSKKKDTILMWSHYTDYHTGLCLEFDILKDANCFTLALPIIPTSQMPEYNHFKEHDKLFEKVIQPKADFWEYEEEIRIVKTPEDIKNNHGSQAFKFNPKALTKVIFGCKATPTTIEKYRRLCNVPDFKHVKFSKMESLTDGTFGLIEKEI